MPSIRPIPMICFALAASGVISLPFAGDLVAQTRASVAATYDATRRVNLKGPVTQIDWVNPNAYLFVDSADAAGTVTNWAVEIGNPIELEHSNWNRDTVKIGDTVTIAAYPARGDHNIAMATAVTLAGRTVFTKGANAAAAKAGPAPRRADGKVRLGGAPGETGYWGNPSATVLVEIPNGQTAAPKIDMDGDGILANLSDLDRVAPFKPWAKAVFEYRQRTLLRDDPYTRCVPAGGPRQFQMPNGFQIVEQPELGRVLLLLGGGDRNWRMIYTDGRPVNQPDEVPLTYYGTSVGHWEGDTLVVDSVGYNESFWFTNGGLPHTEALHLIERFTRTNHDTLRYQVTVDDPRAYTRQWTGGWTMRWVANREMDEFFCEENAESTFTR